MSYNKTSVFTVSSNIRSPLILSKNYTPYLPQCKVQVRGVVAGLRDINHCVAAQRQIRAIYAQPYPIVRTPYETWERVQTVARDACTDVGEFV